jgi:hypothetical protein
MKKTIPQKSPKVQSHLRLTPGKVKQLWDIGLYNAATYLHHLFSAMKAQGWAITIKCIDSFCLEWGINKRTFYKAKARLIDLGLLTEEIMGSIEITVQHLTDAQSFTDDAQSFTDDAQSFTDDAQSFTDDAQSFTDDAQSFTDDAQSFTDDAQSFTDDAQSFTTTPLNGNDCSAFGGSPDLIQISFRSNSDLSHKSESEKKHFVPEPSEPTPPLAQDPELPPPGSAAPPPATFSAAAQFEQNFQRRTQQAHGHLPAWKPNRSEYAPALITAVHQSDRKLWGNELAPDRPNTPKIHAYLCNLEKRGETDKIEGYWAARRIDADSAPASPQAEAKPLPKGWVPPMVMDAFRPKFLAGEIAKIPQIVLEALHREMAGVAMPEVCA